MIRVIQPEEIGPARRGGDRDDGSREPTGGEKCEGAEERKSETDFQQLRVCPDTGVNEPGSRPKTEEHRRNLNEEGHDYRDNQPNPSRAAGDLTLGMPGLHVMPRIVSALEGALAGTHCFPLRPAGAGETSVIGHGSIVVAGLARGIRSAKAAGYSSGSTPRHRR